MSQLDDARSNARDLAQGLRKLGPNRTVALSVHVTKALLEELEIKANKLVEQLDQLS